MGAILSVSHPSVTVKVHYISTRNVQLMHCNGGNFCWRLGGRSAGIERVGSGEGLSPSPGESGGLPPEQILKIISLRMKFLAFSQYTKQQFYQHDILSVSAH